MSGGLLTGLWSLVLVERVWQGFCLFAFLPCCLLLFLCLMFFLLFVVVYASFLFRWLLVMDKLCKKRSPFKRRNGLPIRHYSQRGCVLHISGFEDQCFN